MISGRKALRASSEDVTVQADTAIFDVDGTLVDTNYQHALAWYQSFLRFGIVIPVWRIHRTIGMGGDQLVAALAGENTEKDHGDALRETWSEEFDSYIDDVQAFDGAHELLSEVKRRGFKVVLASSGKQEHVERFIDLIDAKTLADAWTSSDDVTASKPEPDLVRTALEKVSGSHGVMIGDSTWDIIAANKLRVPTIAVQTGGYSPKELTDAGAVDVFESLPELTRKLDSTLLNRAHP
ncbi:MAG: HAD family hydrolase [Gordonia sp. (in: high G+C Gram-positive bacteria)]|nr:MAG: HAD family hydrolase [Gordonia sp. (in: high G+C Gram-positive bacteria)]